MHAEESCGDVLFSSDNIDYIGASFQRDGFAGPINVISKEEAASALKEVRHELRREGSSRFKLHLILPCIDRIVHHPKLVSAVQQALGSENLLLWSSDINIKEANTPHYFEPHQDCAYACLSPSLKCLTAWVALSDPVDVVDGCLQFYPQSHKMGKLLHSTTQQNQNNLLSLGQYIDTDEKEQEYICRLPTRYRKLAERSMNKKKDEEYVSQSFSWIFDRKA